jgi:iron uptake system component EfeO
MTDPASRYCLSSGCYDELTKKDRNTVRGPVTALAEDLSRLRGELALK